MKNNLIKNKKHVDFFASSVIILLVAIMLLSCGKADISISKNKTEPDCIPVTKVQGAVKATVNISSGVFHLDENCRFVSAMKDENKKIIFCEDVKTLTDDGYRPCSVCASYCETEIGGTDG